MLLLKSVFHCFPKNVLSQWSCFGAFILSVCLFARALCRPALWHMPLTASLFLETAALVTLRHSCSQTHTHAHERACLFGVLFFFNLGDQQSISHSCATPSTDCSHSSVWCEWTRVKSVWIDGTEHSWG